MTLRPITIKAARRFVGEVHRHLPGVTGGLFAIAAEHEGKIVGVAIVGLPKARMSMDGWTCEITRCATDGTPNACSFLYGRARRAAQLLGYRRVDTKTLEAEPGSSLRAAGFEDQGLTSGGEWDRKSRKRRPAMDSGRKRRWRATLPAAPPNGEKP